MILFKIGDAVEYIGTGEPGTVIEINGPDFGILWVGGDESWAEEEDLRHAAPLARGDAVTLNAEVIGSDGQVALLRIHGMTEIYLVPVMVAQVTRKFLL